MKMFSPIRMITAVFFLIGAALGAPAPVSDAGLSVGQTAYAAQVSAKEQGPSYWQMYYNFAPPTDEFIAGLAAAAASSTSSPTASRIGWSPPCCARWT